MDLFDLWRWMLGVACTVYATMVTLRWAVGWIDYLARPQRGSHLLRQYLLVQLLRVRWWRFRRELAEIVFWAAAFVGLMAAHRRL